MTDNFKFNDPIIIDWRKDYVDRTDEKKIVNNVIPLEEVPDTFYKVKIDGYVELDSKQYESTKTIASNEFVVNYAVGRVYFNSSEDGKTVFAKYKGKGLILYPASRIYAYNKNPDVVENLQDIIDNSKLSLDDAQKVLDDAKQNVEDAKEAIDNSLLVWKPFVFTYSDLLSNYPNPELGWYVQVKDTGIRYRWDGQNWVAISQDNAVTNSLKTKVVVFVIPSNIFAGVQKVEIRFPFVGKIVDAYASCSQVGDTNTVIQLEKCSQADYDAVPKWQGIFDDGFEIVIEGNEKSSTTSTNQFSLSTMDMNINDHLRVNVLEVGSGITDVTIELSIEITI